MKKIDVLIERGMSDRDVYVWADGDIEGIVIQIDGVVEIYGDDTTQYHVWLDPRYDREELIAEIEAQIKIKGNIK